MRHHAVQVSDRPRRWELRPEGSDTVVGRLEWSSELFKPRAVTASAGGQEWRFASPVGAVERFMKSSNKVCAFAAGTGEILAEYDNRSVLAGQEYLTRPGAPRLTLRHLPFKDAEGKRDTQHDGWQLEIPGKVRYVNFLWPKKKPRVLVVDILEPATDELLRVLLATHMVLDAISRQGAYISL